MCFAENCAVGRNVLFKVQAKGDEIDSNSWRGHFHCLRPSKEHSDSGWRSWFRNQQQLWVLVLMPHLKKRKKRPRRRRKRLLLLLFLIKLRIFVRDVMCGITGMWLLKIMDIITVPFCNEPTNYHRVVVNFYMASKIIFLLHIW